jgi:putative hydrolase of the HAD superfamily
MPEDSPTIRALLIDLDGVIRHWSSQARATAQAEHQAGLPAGAIAGAAFAPDLLTPAIAGAISDEEWRRRIAARLSAEFPGAAVAAAVEAWSASPGEVDAAVLDLVRHARRRATVVLVTNATSRLDRDLARLGLTEEFDHVVNSSAIGWIKPQREIFDHALRVAAARPLETLFVDDRADFVAEAVRLGLLGHHFRDVAGLASELARRGMIG